MHLLTQSAALRALGWSLFNSLWQMALLWLLYCSLIKIFKEISAHARHGLALLFLGVGSAWAGLSFVSVLWQGADPAAPFGSWAGAPSGVAFLVACGSAARRLMNEGLPYFSFLYLLVLVFLFIRYSNHYLHSRRLKTTGLSRIRPELRLFVTETSRVLGIGKEVKVWLSSLVEGPVTVGFLKPVILIPLATVGNLSVPQLEAILVHELAHIKRNDYFINLAVTVLEILLFFNPFARWFIKDIKREREHCCDDLVMQFPYDPPTYVSALLSLAGGGQQQLALAAAGVNDQFLLQRVRRILRLQSRTGGPGAGPGIRALFLGICALAALAVVTAESGPQSLSKGVAAGLRKDGQFTADLRRDGQKGEWVVTGTGLRASGEIKLQREGKTLLDGKPLIDGRLLIAQTGPVVTRRHSALRPATPAAPSAPTPPAVEEAIPAAAFLHNVARPGDDDADDATVIAQLATAPMPGAGPRAYSIGSDEMAGAAGLSITIMNQGQPYVPGTSFSFQYMEDSTRPEVQLAYWQAAAARELELAVIKMQVELQAKLKALQAAQAQHQQLARQLQRQILEDQVKWQKELLEKQRELKKKLEKMGRQLTVVYI